MIKSKRPHKTSGHLIAQLTKQISLNDGKSVGGVLNEWASEWRMTASGIRSWQAGISMPRKTPVIEQLCNLAMQYGLGQAWLDVFLAQTDLSAEVKAQIIATHANTPVPLPETPRSNDLDVVYEQLGNRTPAIIVQPQTFDEIDALLSKIGLDTPKPVVIVVGGIRDINIDKTPKINTLIQEIVHICDIHDAVWIDGATDIGFIRFAGQARQNKQKNAFNMVGVSPYNLIRFPTSRNQSDTSTSPAEPHHTHFFLIPGDDWGDESPWLAEIALRIAKGQPVLTVVINGGLITWSDWWNCYVNDIQTLIIEGTGRTADAIAAPLRRKKKQIEKIHFRNIDDTETIKTFITQKLTQAA